MARQTVLNFPTVNRTIRSADENSQHAKTSSTQPAPELPMEIWTIIFSLLGASTITLKSFRLVCRQWADVGADALFNTAYLDSYTASWSNLRSLCTSSHAHRVKTIQWNPLLLQRTSLDASRWCRAYSNLLHGASHTHFIHLHQAFCTTYQTLTIVSGSDDLAVKQVSRVIHNLTSCRQVLLSDTMDVETSFHGINPAYIHSNHIFWKSAGVWGKNAPFAGLASADKVRNDRDAALSVAVTLLSLAATMPSLLLLTLDLWQTNFAHIFGDNVHRIPLTQFQILQCRLKFCNPGSPAVDEFLWTHSQDSLCPAISKDLLLSLPQVRKISLETVYTDPGSEFVTEIGPEIIALLDYWEREFEDPDTTHDDNCPPRRVVTKFSQIEDEIVGVFDQPPAMASVREANVKLSNSISNKLEQLSFSNVTIDLRVLIFWLADMSNMSRPPLKLKFTDNVILCGMSKSQFFATIAALAISFTYDDTTTFHHYHNRRSWDNDYDSWCVHRYNPSRHCYLRMLGWAKPYGPADDDDEIPASLLRDPDPDDFVSLTAIKQVNFTHIPSDYKRLFDSDLSHVQDYYRNSTSYMYCCFMTLRLEDDEDNGGTETYNLDYQWVSRASFPSFFSPDFEGKWCICILMELTIANYDPTYDHHYQ